MISPFTRRLKWHIAKLINLSNPCHIDLELSTKCNLRCSFCFREEHKYTEKTMPWNIASEIIKQCSDSGVDSIKFNWRGESGFNSDLNFIVNYANCLGLHTMLNTNLSYNCSKTIWGLIRVKELKVSIDSSDSGKYEKIRVGANWGLLNRNLYNISDFRKDVGHDPIIINRRTTPDLEPNADFIKHWGAEYNYDIRPVMKRNKNSGITPKTERKYCGQPSRRMVVDVNGNVWACCCAYAEPQELYLGNIKKSTIPEIWNNPKRLKLISELKKGIYTAGVCQNCVSGESYK